MSIDSVFSSSSSSSHVNNVTIQATFRVKVLTSSSPTVAQKEEKDESDLLRTA